MVRTTPRDNLKTSPLNNPRTTLENKLRMNPKRRRKMEAGKTFGRRWKGLGKNRDDCV